MRSRPGDAWRGIPILLVVLLEWAAASAADLRVGAAAVTINPPASAPLAGYYHARGNEGVLDDLHAKAAVLDDGTTRVAFVVCDLIGLPRHIVEETRALIEEKTGIPGAHVMLSATHTHTGPSLSQKSARDELDGDSRSVREEYTRALSEKICRAAAKAAERLAPARVFHARAQEHRLAYNRRFWMKDGTVGWNPGKLNPRTIRPAGPIDPEVGVIYFAAPDGTPVVTYVNYAMHTDTTGGVRVSADFPGALARCLATYRGPDMVTLFGNGPCGNLNHYNVDWADRQHGPHEANRLGTILAASVFKSYMDLKPVADSTLRVRSVTVRLPLARVTEDDVRSAREVVQRGEKAGFMERVQAYKALDVVGRAGEPIEAEVQVITLGRVLAWVALPGEVFVELGLSIKAASPFEQTHVVELANGSIGYVPDRPAYAEGNYEVVSARCGEGSGELLVAGAISLLQELHP